MVLTCPQSRAACQCGGRRLTRRQTGRPAARRCWVEGCLQQHTAGTGTALQGHHTLPLVSLFVFKTWMIASTGLNNKVFDDEKSFFTLTFSQCLLSELVVQDGRNVWRILQILQQHYNTTLAPAGNISVSYSSIFWLRGKRGVIGKI